MAAFQLFDTVALTKALPQYGLEAGALGAIVIVFDSRPPAYEVEFTDHGPSTTGLLHVPLSEPDLRLVERHQGGR